MEDSVKDMILDSILDLVNFFNILREDMRDDINRLADDLDNIVAENMDINHVEVIHTGSSFEKLSLPHIENFKAWNTDADHMIIRTDIEVKKGCKVKIDQQNMAIKQVLMENQRKSCEAERSKHTEEFKIDQEKVVIKQVAIKDEITKSNETFVAEDNIVYIYDGLHAGYVLVSNKILSHAIDMTSVEIQCKQNYEFVKKCQAMIPVEHNSLIQSGKGIMTGPSYAVNYMGSPFNIHRDFVFGLKCKFWPSQAQEWIHRQRFHGWPSNDLITASVKQGCHIVPVGSHTSALKEFEWRFSFSVIELKLAKSMSEKQRNAYCILKAIIKNEMKQHSIDCFASYHLKTALFWFLEKNGEQSWEKESLGRNILDFLDFCITFYADGVLPNYFIPNNNMIDHRSSEEILATYTALKDIRSDIPKELCQYMEGNQALPVFFDIPLTLLLEEQHRDKFFQLCKYNFFVMALAYILMQLKMRTTYLNVTIDVVSDMVYKASRHFNNQHPASDEKRSMESPTTTSILVMIEECLQTDKLKVTETSAVILAVFNVFLTFHPTSLDIRNNTKDLIEYLNSTVQLECLLWATRLHETHCDVIYDFVVKKWASGPEFHTTDRQAEQFKKLLMVVLGKPTKQACAVTGSLVRRDIEGQRFLLLRILAEYLLYVHVECSYVTFQAAAFLTGRSVLSEIFNKVNHSYAESKLRAIQLILSKEELKNQLPEDEVNRLAQLIITLRGEIMNQQ